MQLVEKIGSGIKRMRDLMRENNLPEPVFDNKRFFNITFVRDTKNVRNDVRNDDIKQLTERQKLILGFIKNEPTLSAARMSVMMSVHKKTIERDIIKLKSLGFIEREGGNAKGHWIVLK